MMCLIKNLGVLFKKKMKRKVLILGSSSFSGATMVNFLLSKKNFLVYGTYRRKKIQSYLPYTQNKNFKLFKNFQIDFLKSSKKLLKIILGNFEYVDFTHVELKNSENKVLIDKILDYAKKLEKFS